MKIKVISLNIWEGNFLERAIDFLKQESADILFLQEVYGENDSNIADQFRTLEILKEKLGFAYSYFVPGMRHNRSEGMFLQGNAILTHFPIKNSSAVFFNDPYNDNFIDGPENNPKYPHTLQHAVLDTPIGEINAFNLHGTWDLDGDNYSEKRQQMSQAVIDALKGKDKVILAGDTNAKPTNQAIKNIEEHLKSVFGDELKTTFNMKHKDNPGYATAAVDMVFVSPDVTVEYKLCPNVDVSDHLPLVALLQLSGKMATK
jgi:endonuclease/exonuclease/phosphatase family metal-dependent hydrolase